ncbi:MAG TPA: hypothetical protein VII57_01445 [Dehalococcoidia bacterium]
MQEFDDDLLEPYPVDGSLVPLIRLTRGGPPHVAVKVGDKAYHYDRSYPFKGQGAVLPRYLREQLAAGKQPLLIERADRFYVYLAD